MLRRVWSAPLLLLLSVLALATTLIGAAPRYAAEKRDKDGGRLEYTISHGESEAQRTPTMTDVFRALGRSGVVQSLMGAFTGGSDGGYQRRDNPSLLAQAPQSHPSFTGVQGVKNPRESPLGVGATRTYAMKTIDGAQHHDMPLPARDRIDIAPSIDARPEYASAKHSLPDEWKRTLFGPSGLLTEVFNFINEKRKQGLEKIQLEKASQHDPPSVNGANDFAKVLDTLLTKAKTGDFDEPLPEIPFLGICNRLSCGDIYKAVDEFRKSELFSNMQTAISLLHDQKGWDIIGELLANPELVENYIGNGAGLQEFINSNARVGASVSHGKTGGGGALVKPSDGDLGVDFSHLVDGSSVNVDGAGAVEVAASVDASPDYYSAVDGEKSVRASSSAASRATPAAASKLAPMEAPLPAIMESIDEFPGEEGSVTLEKEESVKTLGGLSASQHYRAVVDGVHMPTREVTVKKRLHASEDAGANNSTLLRRNAMSKRGGAATTPASIVFKPRGTTSVPTTPPSTPVFVTLPKSNFRKSDDYYAMYYDEG